MAIKFLLTIGYEGATLADFIDAITDLKVTTVVDVRQLPLSRKKGFSKTSLGESLQNVGVSYRHVRALGCPPEIRARLKATGDYHRYFVEFNKYLRGQLSVIEQLISELDGRVALLCYERDPEFCHRRSVAERMKDLSALNPHHVAVPG